MEHISPFCIGKREKDGGAPHGGGPLSLDGDAATGGFGAKRGRGESLPIGLCHLPRLFHHLLSHLSHLLSADQSS